MSEQKEVLKGQYRIAVFVEPNGYQFTNTVDTKEEAEHAKKNPWFKCFATRWRHYETWKGKY